MRVAFFALLALSVPGYSQKFSPENLGPDIPTPQIIVDRMLELARLKPGDVLYDLGSGDGRVIITAAQKFGARSVGIEILPDLVRKTRQRVQSMGLDDKVRVIEGSALHTDLSQATVVTMCLLTSSNERLKPNLEKFLKPGARVVSNEFPIKSWKPVEVVQMKVGKMDHTIYLYEIGREK